jgi:predicted TIM-barrel fold metal-dependent hydrolase
VDTCLSTGRYRQVERVVKAIGVERVVFATDAAFNSAVAGFAKVAMADLPDDEKRLVLAGNARRIFGSRLPQE